MSRTAMILGFAASITVTAEPLAGQVLAGRLLDRESGDPLGSSYVVLTDTAGTSVRAPTDGDGSFILRAPAPGKFSLHAERIGFDLAEQLEVQLPAEGGLERDLRVSVRPISLASLSPGATCRITSPSTDLRGVLWSELQKALHAAEWTASYQAFEYRTQIYQRDIDFDGHLVKQENSSVMSGLDRMPSASGNPDSIAEFGYVSLTADDAINYYIPDPAVLLHTRFDETHCFSIARIPGLIGLEFTPTPERLVPEVEGTIWIDESSAELIRLDFRFVNGPSGIDNDRLGGSITFETVGSTDWIIRDWQMRMPSVGKEIDGERPLFGFSELGARVIQVRNEESALFTDDKSTFLSGEIFDSTSAMPLAGAVVALAGTEHWATTDDRGQFFLAGDMEGDYSLVFGHPRLDSLGFISTPTRLSLRPDESISIALAVPSLPSVINARCGGPIQAVDRRVLLGVVRDSDTDNPVAGALVSVSWQAIPEQLRRFGFHDLGASAVTDSLGSYALCNVPTRRSITVNAGVGDRMSDVTRVLFGDGVVQIGSNQPQMLDRPVGRLDLTLVAATDRNTELTGQVTNVFTNQPLAGANVQLRDTPFRTATDTSGVFRFVGLPAGDHSLTIRRLGFSPLQHGVQIVDGYPLAIPASSLQMNPADDEIVRLDPLVVEAYRGSFLMQEFEERRQIGLGSFVDRSEFEKWNPAIATDVLRRMQGIRVRPNPRYGRGGDARRFLIESTRDMGDRVASVRSLNQTNRGLGYQPIVVTECPVLVFIDGAFVGDTKNVNIDNFITINALAGVEVYSPSQAPARFNLSGSTCGIAAFWTR